MGLDRLMEIEVMLERTKAHRDRQALLYIAERWRRIIDEAKLELGIG